MTKLEKLEQGLIEMIIPDKRCGGKRRYRITTIRAAERQRRNKEGLSNARTPEEAR